MVVIDLYAEALRSGGDGLVAIDCDGRRWPLPVRRWLGVAQGADERLLDRVSSPALDIGCGPGRHVRALAQRGVLALGVDVSPVAVQVARDGGAPVFEASVFDRLPSDWATALLLDGNLGIGGDPVALLRRVGALLDGGGRVLVECDPWLDGLQTSRFRLEHDGLAGEWFRWARVGPAAIARLSQRAGLRVERSWSDDGRRFAELSARST